MYALDSINLIMVRFNESEPGATGITSAILLADSAKVVTTDMSGFAIAEVVWLPVWDVAIAFTPILPSVLVGGMKPRVPPVEGQ